MNQVTAPAPTQNLTTPGKPSALGPPSDTPAAPRPAADARARAIEAARQAKRDAEGKFLPKEPETTEAKAEVSAAAPADSTPEAAEGSGEAAATPPPENEIDVRTRVRQREMRIQRELQEREARIAAREAQFSQERQQFETERQKYARLEQLRDQDPVAWAKEIQLDKVMEPIVKARLLAGKPEGQIMSVEQKVDALRQQYEADRQAEQQRQEMARATASRQSYIQLAVNNKNIEDVIRAYGNEGQEFIDDAVRAMNRIAYRRKVSPETIPQEEILAEHVRWFRDRWKRPESTAAATPAPAAAPAPAPKPKIPSPADAARTAPIQRGERVESDRERRQRAALEARKAMAATNKRTRGQ